MKRELPPIGSVKLDNPFILGPMAGVTDMPFRMICREMGAALVCMEMVSANAVYHGNRKTWELVGISENEHPVSMQLFGPDPEVMAFAAEKLKDVPCEIIDINMGCPVPKIVKNNEGSALMRDIPGAAAIVKAVKAGRFFRGRDQCGRDGSGPRGGRRGRGGGPREDPRAVLLGES